MVVLHSFIVQCIFLTAFIIPNNTDHDKRPTSVPSIFELPVCKYILFGVSIHNGLMIRFNSKTCLRRSLKKKTKIGFQDRLLLNAGQKYCRILQGEHSAILLAFIKLPFVIKTLVLSIFYWPLKTGFTVVVLMLYVPFKKIQSCSDFELATLLYPITLPSHCTPH